MTAMNPRIVLQLLLNRLQPEVGLVSRGMFSAWEGKEAALFERARAGKLHLAGAVLQARRALASGIEEQIAMAALLCASLERTGRELHSVNARRKGGKQQGSVQAAAAALAWKPYVEEFQALRASGKAASVARQRVDKSMSRDGFTLPSTGKPPDPRTMRKWLPAK
jgi:hypothetical protein